MKFPGTYRFPENPRIVEFTEYQSFNREFREESNQSEILGIKFSNI